MGCLEYLVLAARIVPRIHTNFRNRGFTACSGSQATTGSARHGR